MTLLLYGSRTVREGNQDLFGCTDTCSSDQRCFFSVRPPCGPAVAVVSQISLATEAEAGPTFPASAAARDVSWQSDSTKVNRAPVRLFYSMYFVVMSTKKIAIFSRVSLFFVLLNGSRQNTIVGKVG